MSYLHDLLILIGLFAVRCLVPLVVMAGISGLLKVYFNEQHATPGTLGPNNLLEVNHGASKNLTHGPAGHPVSYGLCRYE